MATYWTPDGLLTNRQIDVAGRIRARCIVPHDEELGPLTIADLGDQLIGFITATLLSLSIGLVTSVLVIHELGNRRARDRRNLHQVQLGVACELQRCLDRDDSKLVAAGSDKSDFGRKNLIIDSRFRADLSS